MQAEIVCLRQARRYRAQTRKVGRSIKTIHDSDVAAKLKEYAALLEEVERFGNALRQTLLAQLQEDGSPLEGEISLDNGDDTLPMLAARRLLQQPQPIAFAEDLCSRRMERGGHRRLAKVGPLREGQIAGQ